jgi:hypothetical protein
MTSMFDVMTSRHVVSVRRSAGGASTSPSQSQDRGEELERNSTASDIGGSRHVRSRLAGLVSVCRSHTGVKRNAIRGSTGSMPPVPKWLRADLGQGVHHQELREAQRASLMPWIFF